MDKVYKDTPENFSEIENYVITEPAQIAYQIIQAPKCYFYDTCSFRKHMEIRNPEPVLEYIKKTKGIVIITRTVLMELCSNDNMLWREHIKYIQKMYEIGVTVLVIFEENLFEVITMCFSSIVQANKLLTFAVRNAKSKVGTVSKVLQENELLRKDILVGTDSSDRFLYKKFFALAREKKEAEDNLGEELIAICLHLLSNIPEFVEYKYILLSEDKGAIALLGKTIKNVREYIGKPCITALTTTKLIQLMIEEGILLTKEEIIEILSIDNLANNIRLICSEEYELEQIEKTMNIEELAEKLIHRKSIWIYL